MHEKKQSVEWNEMGAKFFFRLMEKFVGEREHALKSM